MNRVITLIVMDLAMRFGFDAEEGINYLLENEKNQKKILGSQTHWNGQLQ